MRKILKIVFLFFFSFVSFPALVFAHEEDLGQLESVVDTLSFETILAKTSLLSLAIGGGISLFFVLLAIFLRPVTDKVKKILFFSIAVPIVLSTFYLTSSTIYLNLVSQSKGPVHHHADFEIWVCGRKIDLIDPSVLSNRIGTATFHEHGDNRIHVEGVVLKKEDIALGKFFEVIGGELGKDHLELLTIEGRLHADNGDLCPDGQRGFLQVFVYQTKGDVFIQKKLTNPASYIISPYGVAPPGDCVIVEFDALKSKTERLCNFYKLAIEKEKIHGP